jgi:hypothetical protein
VCVWEGKCVGGWGVGGKVWDGRWCVCVWGGGKCVARTSVCVHGLGCYNLGSPYYINSFLFIGITIRLLKSKPCRAATSALQFKPYRVGTSALQFKPCRVGTSALQFKPCRVGTSALQFKPYRVGPSAPDARPLTSQPASQVLRAAHYAPGAEVEDADEPRAVGGKEQRALGRGSQVLHGQLEGVGWGGVGWGGVGWGGVGWGGVGWGGVGWGGVGWGG